MLSQGQRIPAVQDGAVVRVMKDVGVEAVVHGQAMRSVSGCEAQSITDAWAALRQRPGRPRGALRRPSFRQAASNCRST